MGAITMIGAAPAASFPVLPAIGPTPPTLVSRRYSLFEHIADVEQIADMVEALEDADQLDPDTCQQLQRQLVSAIAGTKDKIDRTTSVLASFEAAEQAAKNEADRLAARAKYFARQRDRLEQYVLSALAASGLKKIDGHTSGVAIRLNPPSVLIDAGTELPPEFMKTPPPPPAVPDKTAIKAALQRRENVPGCRLTQTTRLVRS